jgi:hypothetical protein
MSYTKSIITEKAIPKETFLKYLIVIPCVNREERNAINVIDKTFKCFEKSGLFSSNIFVDILLLESGSKNVEYLNCINEYIDKYRENNIKINIMYSSVSLNGNSNTLRMFMVIAGMDRNKYNFVIWMDDDIYVCKNFIENADSWIKKYANYSLFSSLYVPYDSYFIKNKKYIHHANMHGFYGTCCTIFKPELAKYVIPFWNDEHFNKFNYNPDARFRDCLRKYFPKINRICVSFPSLVEHMNIGSAINMEKNVKKGHKAKFFIGEDNDPKFYLKDDL